MKDIKIRTITGVVFLVAVIGSILLHPIAFFILFSFFTVVGLNEFYKLQEKNFDEKPDIIFLISGLLIYVIIALVGLGYIEIKFLFLGLPVIFLQIIFELYRKNEPNWRRLGSIFSAILFVSIPFGFMNTLFFSPQTYSFQTGTLIGFFVIIWTNDVFAYLTGSKFGKHKLFERHSPKKILGRKYWWIYLCHDCSLYFIHFLHSFRCYTMDYPGSNNINYRYFW